MDVIYLDNFPNKMSFEKIFKWIIAKLLLYCNIEITLIVIYYTFIS